MINAPRPIEYLTERYVVAESRAQIRSGFREVLLFDEADVSFEQYQAIVQAIRRAEYLAEEVTRQRLTGDILRVLSAEHAGIAETGEVR